MARTPRRATPRPRTFGSILSILWPLVAGALVLYGFVRIGAWLFDDWAWRLGSIQTPKRQTQHFMLFWGVLGGVAVPLLALGLARLASLGGGTVLARARRIAEARAWLPIAMLLALCVPLCVRWLALHDAPITDDESAYQFMAELLALGKVKIESPPGQAFFDRTFMINDGYLYSQYFLGWPALLMPFVALGQPGLANPFYALLTIPALHALLRRFVGPRWANAGVMLHVSAPMVFLGAATQMAHTSCFCLLTWMLYFAVRSREDMGERARSPWSGAWVHFAVALMFAGAFFNRPTSALGVGLPILIWWFAGLFAGTLQRAAAAALMFALPSLALGGAFLHVNNVQNGSYTKVAYHAEFEYRQVRKYKPKRYGKSRSERAIVNMRFTELDRVYKTKVGALMRLNFAPLGWPSSLLPAAFAGFRRPAGLLWASVICYVLVHFFVSDVGVDTFGPVHFFELWLPMFLLVMIGLSRLHAWCSRRAAARQERRELMGQAEPLRAGEPARLLGARPDALVPALLVALVTISGWVYTARRVEAVATIANATSKPYRTVEALGLHNAVVFVTNGKFASNCASRPHRNYVYWRPNNDPLLQNDVLWLNHRSLRSDRRYMSKYLPERDGYIMVWDRCEVEILPLEGLPPGELQRRLRTKRDRPYRVPERACPRELDGAATRRSLELEREPDTDRSEEDEAEDDVFGGGSVDVPEEDDDIVVHEPRALSEDRPVLYWRLGESEGPEPDLSGNGWVGEHVETQRGVLGVASDRDGATAFGRKDSRVRVRDFEAMPTDEMTIEIWFKQTSPRSKGTLLSYAIDDGTFNGANEFSITDTTDLQVLFGGALKHKSKLNLASARWYQVVVTWESESGELNLYVNGRLETYSGDFAEEFELRTGGTLVLGQDQDAVDGGFQASQQFKGRIDELAIYDRVLNQEEIEGHWLKLRCEKREPVARPHRPARPSSPRRSASARFKPATGVVIPQ